MVETYSEGLASSVRDVMISVGGMMASRNDWRLTVSDCWIDLRADLVGGRFTFFSSSLVGNSCAKDDCV